MFEPKGIYMVMVHFSRYFCCCSSLSVLKKQIHRMRKLWGILQDSEELEVDEQCWK